MVILGTPQPCTMPCKQHLIPFWDEYVRACACDPCAPKRPCDCVHHCERHPSDHATLRPHPEPNDCVHHCRAHATGAVAPWVA